MVPPRFYAFSIGILALGSLRYALSSPLSSDRPAPLYIPDAPAHDLIDNSYIVILNDDVLPSDFSSHLSFIEYASQIHPSPTAHDNGGSVLSHVYDSEIAKGYAGTFSASVVDLIRRRPEVKYVEQESYMYPQALQEPATWGLARINHRTKLTPTDMHYNYVSTAGEGVMVYVIDTGVFIQHAEFEGRARWGMTFFPEEGHDDLVGHGTHVAGTVASRLYGVAKKAEMTSVKVFSVERPSGAGVMIAALEWAAKDAKALAKTRGKTLKGTVVNMSLSGAHLRSLNEAAEKAVTAGMHVVAAAGNDNKDACTGSPASSEKVITVGASTIHDARASFSNYGVCVDVFAPGEDILSLGYKGRDETDVMNGTSMAAPHVAGLVAYFLSIHPHGTFNPKSFPWPGGDDLSPKKVKKAILALASSGKLSGPSLPPGTPNLLVYNNASHSHSTPVFWGQEVFEF